MVRKVIRLGLVVRGVIDVRTQDTPFICSLVLFSLIDRSRTKFYSKTDLNVFQVYGSKFQLFYAIFSEFDHKNFTILILSKLFDEQSGGRTVKARTSIKRRCVCFYF